MFDFEYWHEYVLYKISTHAICYFLLAGLAYLIFWVWKRKDWLFFKIQKKFPDGKIIRNELKWSVLNIMITGFMNLGIYFPYKAGITAIYPGVTDYGWTYLLCSIPVMLVLHDTYFYWTHRLMHRGKIYQWLHEVHHRSTNPTPWTTHSQHPFEVMLQNAFLPAMVFIIPLHPLAIAVFMLIATGFNLLGHLGYELFPAWFVRRWPGKILLTSTYHNLHHERFTKNYGLYFFFWDRLMNTYHHDYYRKFDEVKQGNIKSDQTENILRKP